MRIQIFILIMVLCALSATAQHKMTRRETINFLRQQLSTEKTVSEGHKPLQNSTDMCISCSEKFRPNSPQSEKGITDKDFTDKIASHISWKGDEMNIRNDIFKDGKLTEKYSYKVPMTAIADAAPSNCRINTTEEVNAYRNRPIFITVKKNTVSISHTHFDKGGKAITGKPRRNTVDKDWNSVIPLAINLDNNEELQGKLLNAFVRLAELNGSYYAAK